MRSRRASGRCGRPSALLRSSGAGLTLRLAVQGDGPPRDLHFDTEFVALGLRTATQRRFNGAAVSPATKDHGAQQSDMIGHSKILQVRHRPPLREHFSSTGRSGLGHSKILQVRHRPPLREHFSSTGRSGPEIGFLRSCGPGESWEDGNRDLPPCFRGRRRRWRHRRRPTGRRSDTCPDGGGPLSEKRRSPAKVAPSTPAFYGLAGDRGPLGIVWDRFQPPPATRPAARRNTDFPRKPSPAAPTGPRELTEKFFHLEVFVPDGAGRNPLERCRTCEKKSHRPGGLVWT